MTNPPTYIKINFSLLLVKLYCKIIENESTHFFEIYYQKGECQIMDKYCQLAQIGYQQFEQLVDALCGKWKLRILFFLGFHKVLRYGELKKLLTPITHKMLSMQLKELERDGIIIRTEYPQVPPKVEYSISEKGKSLMPIFEEMAKWIVTHEKQ